MNSSTTPTPAPMLLDLAEASKALRISKSLLWQMSRAGEVPCVRLRRRLLFDPRDLSAWIERQKSAAISGPTTNDGEGVRP